MIHGIDPRIDYAFKRLFGVERNRDLLISLLNAVLEGTGRTPIVEAEILNPFNPADFDDGKLSIVDVKVRDDAGRRYIVEMQMLAHRDVPKRLLFYWAKGYTEQLSSGDDYVELEPTVLICILGEPLFADAGPYHRRFQLLCRETGLLFSDSLEIHTIELSKLGSSEAAIRQPLDVWSWFLQHAGQLDDEALPEPLNTGEIRRAMEELTMIRRNDSEWLKYEGQRLRKMDERALLRQSREEGLQEGQQQEKRESEAKRLRMLQRLLQLPLSTDDELAPLALEELGHRADALERMLEERLRQATP